MNFWMWVMGTTGNELLDVDYETTGNELLDVGYEDYR